MSKISYGLSLPQINICHLKHLIGTQTIRYHCGIFKACFIDFLSTSFLPAHCYSAHYAATPPTALLPLFPFCILSLSLFSFFMAMTTTSYLSS